MPEGALPLIPVIWHLIGAVAQLGERLLCKQEVTGSIPVGSTREPDARCQASGIRAEMRRLWLALWVRGNCELDGTGAGSFLIPDA
jgi:hypothetical protein